MSRSLTRPLAFVVALLLFPALAAAQGLLIHVQPDDHVRLPRPIIIIPPPCIIMFPQFIVFSLFDPHSAGL